MISDDGVYPRPFPNYRLINNLWPTSSDSQLQTGAVRQTSTNIYQAPITETWSQQRRRLRSLFYRPSDHSLPTEPRRTDPFGQFTYRPTYHLKNCHNSGYEASITATNFDTLSNDHHKKQHFVRGVIPGGSHSNKMIYGTDELLRQSEEKKMAKKDKAEGFLYGTEAATKVGKHKATTKPNNALWLEAKCHDDYATRNQKLAFDQDEFMTLHKQEKEREKMKRQLEKKMDFEELISYKPWGKPGHGAPNTGPKGRNKLIEEDQAPYGGYGGGAPLRTNSGKLQTKLRTDRELLFPKGEASGDMTAPLRYAKNRETGKQMFQEYERDLEEVQQRKQQQDKEKRQHIPPYDPYGKPGGGAPRTDEQGNLKATIPITCSKDITELRTMEKRNDPGKKNQDESDSPWGKGFHGIVQRDKAGKVIKNPKPKNDDTEGIGIPVGRPGAGAPNRDSDGKIKTTKRQTLTKNHYGQNNSRDFSPKERDVDYPFGKPGAGAPIKDKDGKVITHLVAKTQHHGMEPDNSPSTIKAKQQYLKNLEDLNEQAHFRRKEQNEYQKKSGGDVASWLQKGVVGKPQYDPVSNEIIGTRKTTSDVTRQKLNIQRQKNEMSIHLSKDLSTQLQEKQSKRDNDKFAEISESSAHVETMNGLFGKPGGGAPLAPGSYRKQKFGIDPI